MQHRSSSPSVTRRQILTGSGALLGATLAGQQWGHPTLSAHQFDSTPPAPPATTPTPSADPIATLAAELNYDQDAIFAFVRDEIHYESYAGVLRGAKGTLWARAGNSADQAVLLAALLSASQIPFRFASGPLSSDATSLLSQRAQPSATSVQELARERITSAFDSRAVESTAPDLTPDLQLVVDGIDTAASAAIDLATTWYAETVDTLVAALSDAEISLTTPSTDLPSLEVDRHLIVQVSNGPQWHDLSPVLASVDPESFWGSPPTDLPDLPEDLIHLVRFRVIAEEIIGGSLVRRDVVVHESSAHQLIEVPVSFMIAPSEGFEQLGQSLSRLYDAAMNLTPAIIVGTDEVTGTVPLAFGTSDASVSSSLETEDEASQGLQEGETIAFWYAVDVISPGQDPITVERTWYDRLTPEERLAAEIPLDSIPPIDMVTLENGERGIPGLDRQTILAIEVARLPNDGTALDTYTTDLMIGTNRLGPSMATLREAMTVSLELPQGGTTSWIASPHVTAFTFALSEPTDPTSALELTTDLLVHPAAATRISDEASPPLPPRTIAGIIDQVAERLVTDPIIWSLDPGTAADTDNRLPGINVGVVFAAARAQEIPFRAVADTEELADLTLPDTIRAQISRHLDAGQLVVAPTSMVDVNGEERFGWWAITPATGATSDFMDRGGSSAAISLPIRGEVLAGPMLEYILTWAKDWWARVEAYKCLGAIIAVVTAAAAIKALEIPPSGIVKFGSASAAATAIVGGCSLIAPAVP